MFDRNSDFPINLPHPKTLEPAIRKLRNSISHGKLELRRELVEKLNMFAMSQLVHGEFENTTDTVKEIVEYCNTFREEGQYDVCTEIAQHMIPMLSVGRAKRTHLNSNFNFQPLGQLISTIVVQLPAEDFKQMKNEWFLDLVETASDWHEFGGVDVATIARLDELQRLIETHLDVNTTMFTEWHPLLQLLKLRGELKHEIGDRLGAIEDLEKFQEVAEKAYVAAHKRTKKMGSIADEPNADGNIVIRIDAEDYVEFVAFTMLPADWFAATFHLADYYAEHADKVNSIKYYDKALDIAQRLMDTTRDDRFMTGNVTNMMRGAPVVVPYRKASLFFGHHAHQQAVEPIDHAVAELHRLLELPMKDAKEVFTAEEMWEDIVRNLYAMLSNIMSAVGRYEEAKVAITESNVMLRRIADKHREISRAKVNEVKEQKGQRRREQEQNVRQQMQEEVARQTDRRSAAQSKQPPRSGKPAFGEDVMHEFYEILQKRCNEAVGDARMANIDMQAGRFRSALRLLLKARFVTDSPLIFARPETQHNLIAFHTQITLCYNRIKRFADAEKWCRRTLRLENKLIDEGKYQAMDELKWLRCGMYNTLADLYRSQGRDIHEVIQQAEAAMREWNSLLDEQDMLLEGQNIEKLRVRDNQRLMPMARAIQSQLKLYTSMSMDYAKIDDVEKAIRNAEQQIAAAERFVSLLPNPEDGKPEIRIAKMLLGSLLIHFGRSEEIPQSIKDDAEVLLSAENGVEHLRNVIQCWKDTNEQGPATIADEDYEDEDYEDDEDEDEDEDDDDYARYYDNEEEDEYDAEVDEDDDTDFSEYEADFETGKDNIALMVSISEEVNGKQYPDETRKFATMMIRHALEGGKSSGRVSAIEDNRGAGRTKVGRNDQCPCGSGNKYKKCCMGNE